MARTMQISYQLYASAASLTHGSHVAMLLDPVADAICCIYAILRSGFVWVPLDTRNHHRLRAAGKESRPQVLLYHNATRTLAQEVISGIGFTSILNINTCRIACLSETVTAESSQDDIKSSDTTSSEPAVMLYTGGFTGVLKGVVFTRGSHLNQIFGSTTTLNLKLENKRNFTKGRFSATLDQSLQIGRQGATRERWPGTIHGIRVELNDISNAIVIVSSGRIVNVAASLRPGQLSDMLIIFVVFGLAFTGDKVDFANWHRNSIPLGQAMMPGLIVPVEQILAAANGKTDSIALNRLPIHDMANLKAVNESVRSLSSMEQSKAIFGARCSLPICLECCPQRGSLV
ncbi:polyketide synthase [Metarhizium robertsii ARSEF 23]|uniref:Polyketide synthase n=1 Tax=Metarhizium robertsii (strain ARSEF 23 / ATCC MYA-3075) TaxID=655844 RepID=E9FB32_METRA|nr:polyketide synthase [Metarhizium robertsii ARSEF 23]EFY95032.2 polyketide synthase [Metarhizium robertsii ARSEF 23]